SPTTRPPPRSTLFPYTTLFRFSVWLLKLKQILPMPLEFWAKQILSLKLQEVVHPNSMVPMGLRSTLTQEKCLLLTEAITEYSDRSEEHTSELQSRENLVCRLLLE